MRSPLHRRKTEPHRASHKVRGLALNDLFVIMDRLRILDEFLHLCVDIVPQLKQVKFQLVTLDLGLWLGNWKLSLLSRKAI